jgi:ABC-2 type transport system ATP-binding protein
MAAIVTRALSKTYKVVGKAAVRSLQGLDLEVAENEVFGFVGRNGAGKTTTIKLLCGLIHASSGGASLFGEDISRRESRRLVGYMPEQPYFYEYLTPRETLTFYGRLRGLSAAQRRAQWDRVAGLLELEDIADRRIRSFSKGMRQRVGFAVALVGDPPLLILDEPMSGLDPIGRRMIREAILRLRDEGKTIFFSSHVLSDVEELCDRIGMLVEGRLVHHGRVDDLPGRRMKEVEVTAEGLDASVAASLAARTSGHRRFDQADLFRVADLDAANALTAEILAAGGRIRALQPLRESLEDFFARIQEKEAAK